MTRQRAMSWLAAIACLHGCASQPVFEGAWFVEASSDYTHIYVTLLNRSDHAETVGCAVLSPFADSEQRIWVLNRQVKLEPGVVVVLDAADFTSREVSSPAGALVDYCGKTAGRRLPEDTCIVPIDVRLFGTDDRPLPIAGSGGLPNALPPRWITRCHGTVLREASPASEPAHAS